MYVTQNDPQRAGNMSLTLVGLNAEMYDCDQATVCKCETNLFLNNYNHMFGIKFWTDIYLYYTFDPPQS